MIKKSDFEKGQEQARRAAEDAKLIKIQQAEKLQARNRQLDAQKAKDKKADQKEKAKARRQQQQLDKGKKNR